MFKFSKVSQLSRLWSRIEILCYHQKRLDIRNMHAEYESSMSYDKNIIERVNVFFQM